LQLGCICHMWESRSNFTVCQLCSLLCCTGFHRAVTDIWLDSGPAPCYTRPRSVTLFDMVLDTHDHQGLCRTQVRHPLIIIFAVRGNHM
jgi:L-ascorbate metabolism protein UlaG (beta-lactamase superfamily)